MERELTSRLASTRSALASGQEVPARTIPGVERLLTELIWTRQTVIERLRDVLVGASQAAGTANLTVARAHHFGLLDWAERSGVIRYRIEAALDGVTCQACRDMHGEVFEVSDGPGLQEPLPGSFRRQGFLEGGSAVPD